VNKDYHNHRKWTNILKVLPPFTTQLVLNDLYWEIGSS